MKNIKRILKRSLAVILTAAMLTGQAGVSAFAAEISESTESNEDVLSTSVETPEQEETKEEKEESLPTEETDEEKSGEESDKESVKEESSDSEKSADDSDSDGEKPSDKEEKSSVSEDKAESPAFEESKEVNGVKITVSAEEGVFPGGNGLKLSVKKANNIKKQQAKEAVEEERSDNENVAASYTYDIKVLDNDGNELQPADESKVKVSFTLDEVSDENLKTNIYHITEENASPSSDTQAELTHEGSQDEVLSEENENSLPLEGKGDREAVDEVLSAEKLEVTTDGTTVTAETDGFSLYTVEFTYENKQYVMPGDSEIPLSTILDTVGLAGEVSDVRVSDEDLFSASDETGEWIVTAHKAFSTEEWMKVTISDVVYDIVVTDSQGDTITITAPVEIKNSNRTQYNGKTLTGTYNPSMDLFDNSKRGAIIIDGETTSLTINDLNINIPGDGEKNVSGILLRNNATLNLTIQGTNSFYAAGDGAGICVPKGCTLNITESSTGSLIADGGCNTDETAAHGGAGIGAEGTNDDGVGTINIKGGTITAIGGSTRLATEIGAAGIGGSIESKDTGIINISGGNVTAKAHYGNAAIGGAYCGRVESITISGGTVTATVSNGSSRGASIGCGTNGNTVDKLSCGTIEITGGKVTANGNIGYGGDIDGSGAGAGYAGGSVNIGEEVVATAVLNVKCDSWEQKAKIEFDANGGTGSMGPYTHNLKTVNWYNLPSTCEFTRDGYVFTGWQIGSKKYKAGDQVVIPGRTLIKPVWASSDLAKLNNAEYDVSENKEFNDVRIEVTGNSTLTLSPGATLTVGKGIHVPGGSTLTIKGEGSLIAKGKDAAAIGGNKGGTCGTIIIDGGTITASVESSSDAAIGGAYNGTASGEVIINGGKVIADNKGKLGSPGIGGTGTSVTINGGIVNAEVYGGDKVTGSAAAIGGNGNSTVAGTITINGGQVTVTGGCGIGHSKTGWGGNIILGWTSATDYIKSNVYNGSVTFRDGFLLEDGETVATTSNIEGKKLIPASLVSIGQFSGGSVTGDGTYKIGSTVTLTASPNENYELESITAAKTGDPSTSVTLSGTGNTRTFIAPAYGVTVTASFKGTLPATAPVIKTQPADLDLATGYTSGSISVTAEPASDTTYQDLAYQWYLNTTESNEGGSTVSGATSADFTIPTGKTEGTYYYYCVVTATRRDNGRTAATTSNVTKVSVSNTKVYIAPDVSAQNREYNGSKTAEISGTGVLKRVKDDEVVDGLTVSGITAAFADKNAGTGKAVSITGATLSGTGAENYTLDLSKTNESLNLTADIDKKTVTITGLTVSNKEYDGTDTATVGGTASVDGKIDSDDVSVSVGTAKFANTVAGEGKTVKFSGFSLSGTDAGNYELISQPEDVTANITKRSVTITANNQSVELNGSIATGTNMVSVTSGSLVDGHAINTVTLTSSSTNAATTSGTITPSDITIKNAGSIDVTENYNIAQADGVLTVTKIKAKVTSRPDKATGLSYTGVAQDLLTSQGVADTSMEYSLDGSIFSGTIPTGINAKSYTVYYRAKEDDNHFAGDADQLTVTIDTVPLTIAAKPKTITYGDIPDNDGVTCTGFVENETESVLGGSLSYDYNYSQYEDVGSYRITPNGLTSDNYDITYASGTLTVEKKKVGLNWSDTSLTYNGGSQIPTASATGLVNSDEVNVTVTGAQTNAGTGYTAEATELTGVKAGNYSLPTDSTITFSIGKASHDPVSVAADVTSGATRSIDLSRYIEAGGRLDNVSFNAGEFIFEADKEGTGLSYTADSTGDVGDTQDITVRVVDAVNYNDYDITVTVTVVEKQAQTLSFAKKEVTIKTGETFTNNPEGAETHVSYKSSNEKVATVDAKGKVTAVAEGKATITAAASETDEYYSAEAAYTVNVEGVTEEKVPLTKPDEKYAAPEDNFAPVASSRKANDLSLDFSKVADSNVKPSELKMTVVNGSKLHTEAKLKNANSIKATGDVKVKVDKKTLIPTITCKGSGSVTMTMADGSTYTVTFTAEKPKAQKAAKNMSTGGKPVEKTVTDLFGTHINAGELTIVKQKHSQAKIQDNALIIDPKTKDSIRIQYKYLNKKYKMTIKVK